MPRTFLLLTVTVLASLAAATEMRFQTIGYIGELFRLEQQQFDERKATGEPMVDEAHKQLAAYYNNLARAVTVRQNTIMQDQGRPSAEQTFSIDIGLVTAAKPLLEKRCAMSLSHVENDRLKQALDDCDVILHEYFSPD